MTTPGPPCSSSGPPRSLKGYLFLGVAFVTCPCHLPLLLAVLAGTGIASALSQYFGLVFLVLSVIFLSALLSGLKVLRGSQQRRT